MGHDTGLHVISALDASRADLLTRVRGLSQERLDWKPSPERWSAGEIVDHLALVEAAVEKLLARLIERACKRDGGVTRGAGPAGPIRLPADVASNITAFPVFPAAAPRHGLPAAVLLRQLADHREDLLARAREGGRFDMSGCSFPHPALGRLDFYQWLQFVVEHERGHTRQMDEMLGEKS
jgi:hypothetical protein